MFICVCYILIELQINLDIVGTSLCVSIFSSGLIIRLGVLQVRFILLLFSISCCR